MKEEEEEEEEVGSGRQKALQRMEGSEAKWGFFNLYIHIYIRTQSLFQIVSPISLS